MANELKLQITADGAQALAALESLTGAVKSTAGQIEGHFSTATHAVENLYAPIAKVIAVLGGGALFKKEIGEAVDFSKEVSALGRVLGVTSEEASATAVAIASIFGDVEGFLAGSSKMIRTLNKNEDAIKKMGIATRDSNGHFRSAPDLIAAINERLGQYKEGIDRDAAAQMVYGRGYLEMLKYVKLTPEVMDAAREKARELGLEMSSQEQSTIKGYRSGMVGVHETLKAFAVRVSLEVMPTLTAASHWFEAQGPAAIKTTVNALQAASTALSYHSVQAGILLVLLRGPVLSAWSAASAAVLRFTYVLQRELVVAALEGTSRLGAMASTVTTFINPWVLAAAAVVALGFAIEYMSRESERHAANFKRASQEQLDALRKQHSAMADVVRLEDSLSTAKSGQEKIQERLQIQTDKLLQEYPGLIQFLKDEAGHRRTITEAVKAYNDEMERKTRQDAATEEASLKIFQSEIDRYKAFNAGHEREIAAGVNQYRLNEIQKLQAYNNAQIAENQKYYDRQVKIAQQSKDKLALLLAANEDPGLRYAGGGDDGGAAAKKAAEAQRKLQEDTELNMAALWRKTQADRQAASNAAARLGRMDLETQRAHDAALLDLEEQTSQQRLRLGEITEQQALATSKRIADLKFQAAFEDLQKEINLLKDLPEEQARANAKLVALQDNYLKELAKLKAEENTLLRNQSGYQGALKSLQDYLKASKRHFDQWHQTVTSVVQGVEDSFATAFKGILSGQMSFKEAMKAIWNGIVDTIITALAEIAAKYLVAAIARAIFGKAEEESAMSTAAAAQISAGAQIFEANAGIPYVGAYIAAAEVAVMEGVLLANAAAAKGISATAYAEGGIIDRPTFGLLGEAGQRELAVPEQTFIGWATGFAQNIMRSERQIQSYRDQGTGYARAASHAARQGRGDKGLSDALGRSQIITASERDRKTLRGLQTLSRQRGAVLRAGSVLGGA